MIGLACATRVLDCNEPRNQAQHLRLTSLRLEQIFFVGDELLGGGRDRTRANDGHLRYINDFGVRIVGEGRGDKEQKRGEMEEEAKDAQLKPFPVVVVASFPCLTPLVPIRVSAIFLMAEPLPFTTNTSKQ